MKAAEFTPGIVYATLLALYADAEHLLTPRWREERRKTGIPATGFCYIGLVLRYGLAG